MTVLQVPIISMAYQYKSTSVLLQMAFSGWLTLVNNEEDLDKSFKDSKPFELGRVFLLNDRTAFLANVLCSIINMSRVTIARTSKNVY